jgi:hypothetical protein
LYEVHSTHSTDKKYINILGEVPQRVIPLGRLGLVLGDNFEFNIKVNRYTETNMMHVSFNLLRIKGLYMFRALLAHPQEVLHKRHLGYCLRIMSVDCGTVAVSLHLAHHLQTTSKYCSKQVENFDSQ